MKRYYYKIFTLTLTLGITSKPVILFAQPNFETYFTAPSRIMKVAGNGDAYAYITEEKLYLYNDNTTKEFTNSTYTFLGQTYTVPLKDNITDIAVNGDSRVYVRTKNNHTLIYEDGKIIGGLPLESSDLFTDYDHEVYSNLLIDGNWIPSRFLYQTDRIRDMLFTVNYPTIQSQINAIRPKSMTYYDKFGTVITGDNGNSIAYGYGDKIKIHRSPESFLPCSDIQDISLGIISTPIPDRTEYLQIYTVCQNGDIAFSNRRLSGNNEDVYKSFVSEEWKNIPTTTSGWGKAQKVFHVGLKHIYAYTDATQNSILVFNALKGIVCRIDVPGTAVINDMYYSPFNSLRGEILVAAGNTVFAFKTDDVSCESGISSTETAGEMSVSLTPNPSDGHITVLLPETLSLVDTKLHVYDVTGHLVWKQAVLSHVDNYTLHLPKGMYFAKLIHPKTQIPVHKLIIH